jgi:8-oxo-dGTP pyrophosphatase MutT (NUDIX family)
MGIYDYRLPGGKVIDALAEYLDIIQWAQDIMPYVFDAARREWSEEVGIQEAIYTFFAKSTAWSTIERDLYYCLATDAVITKQQLEDGEYISHQSYTYEEVLQMILTWAISEDRSANMLLKYMYSKWLFTTALI